MPLIHGCLVELDLAHPEIRTRSGHRGNFKTVPLKRHDFVVIQVNHIPRVRHDRAHIAREKMLTLPDPKNQRAPAPRTDHDPRHIRMHHRNPIGPDHLPQPLPHGLDEPSLVASRALVERLAHQMRQNLGVRLRVEFMPSLHELLAE